MISISNSDADAIIRIADAIKHLEPGVKTENAIRMLCVISRKIKRQKQKNNNENQVCSHQGLHGRVLPQRGRQKAVVPNSRE